MKITGVVLAAGKSSRMGKNKLLMKFKNHTVIEETISQLLNSKVDDVIVVTGYESSRVKQLLNNFYHYKITIVKNNKYELGRAESIKCGIKNISSHADAVLFMVGDKPTVNALLINRAIEKFKGEKPLILYVKTPKGRGHPIIFSRELFSELLLLEGDRIGYDLINSYKNKVVEFEDKMEQVDIDTIQDYRMVLDGNENC